jgi:hypothetical protein
VCTDGPGAPSTNTDGLSLQEGDPPPPPLDDGGGRVTLGSTEANVAATEIGTQQLCVPPEFEFEIEGEYFQNKTEKNAWIHIIPVSPVPEVPASGSGTIHETANNPDQKASGTLKVVGSDLQEHEIHLRDYAGTSLFLYDRGNFFGFTGGNLVAEVMACGETTTYEGTLRFSWFCEECKDDDF